MLAVFAVNPAPNAKAQNRTQLLLRSQEVCNGVTCGHGDSTEGADLGGDGASAWSQIQTMRAFCDVNRDRLCNRSSHLTGKATLYSELAAAPSKASDVWIWA